MRPHLPIGLCLIGLSVAPPAFAGDDRPERVEGRVVAVERDGDSGRVCLTVNMGVPWRDHARDTAVRDEESIEKAAAKGEQSVSTGQPDDKSALVKVYLTDDTTLRLRYRAQRDEQSLGAESADAARKLAASQDGRGPEPGSKAGKAVERSELKRGLFVVAGCTREGEEERADWLVILEPVLQDEP